MKPSILFSSLLFLFLTSAVEDQIIIWNENIKLTWKDYLGKPPANHFALAGTTVTIDFFAKTLNGETLYFAQAKMNRNISWVKPGNQNNPALLRHEQLHFDITELHARLIRKYLASFNGNFPKSKDGLEKLLDYVNNIKLQSESENLHYDKESEHHKNKMMQEKWESDVNRKLNELKNYK